MVQELARCSTIQASAPTAGLESSFASFTVEDVDLICWLLHGKKKKFDGSYDFSNVALFPWTLNSLDTLWDGEYADRNATEWADWESVAADLYGAIAAVGNHRLYIKTHNYKYSVDLPEQTVSSDFVLPRFVPR